MNRVLIAGCGDLGTAVGERLAARGVEVFGLRRNPAGFPATIHPVAADLASAATLSALPANLDAVVYAAAAGRHDEAAYRAAYDAGLGNLLGALVRQGQRPRRILFTSSTSVYGRGDGGEVDEETLAAPSDFAGRWLRAGEERLWAAPFPAVVLRLAGIYGPGRTALVDAVRGGRARCVPGLFTNRIHRDDAAAAVVHLLAHPDAERLYLGVDDAPAEQCEVMRWLAARLGAPAPLEQDQPGPVEAGLRGNKRCRNARLRASGFVLRYPTYREGYAALLDAGAP